MKGNYLASRLLATLKGSAHCVHRYNLLLSLVHEPGGEQKRQAHARVRRRISKSKKEHPGFQLLGVAEVDRSVGAPNKQRRNKSREHGPETTNSFQSNSSICSPKPLSGNDSRPSLTQDQDLVVG
jgi:hypothetical protein